MDEMRDKQAKWHTIAGGRLDDVKAQSRIDEYGQLFCESQIVLRAMIARRCKTQTNAT